MATYFTYNISEQRWEIVWDEVLVNSFDHDDTETGHSYITYNPVNTRLEFYSGGVIVRSFL